MNSSDILKARSTTHQQFSHRPPDSSGTAYSQNGTSAGENRGVGIMYSQLFMYNTSNGKTIKWDWWRDEDVRGGERVCVCLWGGGYWRIAGSDCLSMHVCVPPGGTNVSFEQFVDSPLSSWPSVLQTGSIFWILGMPNVSCGHQCVIQMPWLHRHHILLCSWISGLIFCSHAVQTVF